MVSTLQHMNHIIVPCMNFLVNTNDILSVTLLTWHVNLAVTWYVSLSGPIIPMLMCELYDLCYPCDTMIFTTQHVQ